MRAVFAILTKHCLEEDVPEFCLDLVCCQHKHHNFSIFPPDHEFSFDAESCSFIKEEITTQAFDVLTTIETRLVISAWLETHKEADLLESERGDFFIPPNISETIFDGSFNIYDDTVIYAIARMRSDLIAGGFQRISIHNWWSGAEFASIRYTLQNFFLSPETAVEFHVKTGILSKTTTAVTTFATQVKKLCLEKKKGAVSIPPTTTHMEEAPPGVQSSKVCWSWTSISSKDCAELNEKIELVNGIRSMLMEMPSVPEPQEDEMTVWSDYHKRVFFERLSAVGVDRINTILQDERLPFVLVTKNNPTSIPDFARSIPELVKYVLNNETSYIPPNRALVFVMPTTQKIRLRYGNQQPKKQVEKKKRPPPKSRSIDPSSDSDLDLAAFISYN